MKLFIIQILKFKHQMRRVVIDSKLEVIVNWVFAKVVMTSWFKIKLDPSCDFEFSYSICFLILNNIKMDF